jgi:hypothetical protein
MLIYSLRRPVVRELAFSPADTNIEITLRQFIDFPSNLRLGRLRDTAVKRAAF